MSTQELARMAITALGEKLDAERRAQEQDLTSDLSGIRYRQGRIAAFGECILVIHNAMAELHGGPAPQQQAAAPFPYDA